jgi:hypothetical protein
MRLGRFCSLIGAVLVVMIGTTRAADTDLRAFVGTWKQNQSKSRNAISATLTYTFTEDADGFVSIVRANTPVHDRVRFDGNDYPVSAGPNQTVSWKRISDTVFESTIKRDGALLASARWILSDGGKRLAQETTPVRANGENDVNVIEYVRSSGQANTILGTWTPVSSRSLVPDLFTITLVDDELRAFYPKYGYVVYAMRLDGHQYPLTAPNNAGAEASSAAESVDTRTIRRTTYQRGRPTLQVVMHVSDDGNEMTATISTPGSAGAPSIDIYERQ